MKIFTFIKNVFLFRKEIYNFRSYDWTFSLDMFRKSVEILMEHIKNNGDEIKETRDKKIAAMEKSISLMEDIIEDNFLEKAEEEFKIEFKYNLDFAGGKNSNILPEDKENNIFLIKRATEIEENTWNELFRILKGQDMEEFKEIGIDEKAYFEKFDGTGIKGWWD